MSKISPVIEVGALYYYVQLFASFSTLAFLLTWQFNLQYITTQVLEENNYLQCSSSKADIRLIVESAQTEALSSFLYIVIDGTPTIARQKEKKYYLST